MFKRSMPLPYNAETLRQQDKNRFLLSLMTPHQHRDALWALFAFNHEIAKTREVVTETQIGLIRLQWWRDAIKEIYEGDTVREHVVVKSLAEAIKHHDLPRELFDNLIYAREFDLEGVAPANLDGLKNYCDFTNTPLNTLALKVLHEEDEEETIKHISLNYGLVGLMRSLPHHLSQRRVFITQDILKTHELNETALLDFNQREKLPAIVKEILSLTNFTVAPRSKFLKRMQKMSFLYANQIKSVNYDIFDPRLTLPPKFLALRLLLK